MEKKQHDSWVTVRQESRKLTEAQNEMQTLRARLTVAETKLAEKTVEIDNLMQENQTMKETMDRINNHQILKSDNTSKYFHIFLLKLYCILKAILAFLLQQSICFLVKLVGFFDKLTHFFLFLTFDKMAALKPK